jgi:hypothetical protein
LLGSLFGHREDRLEQDPEFWEEREESMRTDWYYANCKKPIIVGQLLSIQYSIAWYGAGAVHSNYHPLTFVFNFEPLFLISGLLNLA